MARTSRLHIRTLPTKRDLFIKRRSFAFWIFLALSAVALLISFTALQNGRARLDRALVSVPLLSAEFEGYSLLVVSDLHGKAFGEDQQGLVQTLGDSRFDVVIFAGDMVQEKEADPSAFYATISALASFGKPMYYTRGNHDPASWSLQDGDCLPSPFLQGALDLGVQLLDRPYSLRAGDSGSLWLWPLASLASDVDSAIETTMASIESLRASDLPDDLAQLAYNKIMLDAYIAQQEAQSELKETDIHIAVDHYPLTPQRVHLLSGFEGVPMLKDVDLVIAGHYHAGQWRIPLLGALYVPAPELPRGGFFPKQEYVAGLMRVEGVQQYVARGLGATGPKPVRFRLFNAPELALLTLTSRVE